MDIAVVDFITNKYKGRFCINYIFWNMVKEVRIILKIFNNGLAPIYSLESLFNQVIG
jgi:hypothetical protein